METTNETQSDSTKPWPPRLLRDWEGHRARLRRTLQTKRGDVFVAGEVLQVNGHHRGRFTLYDAADPNRMIRQVPRHYFELLRPPTTEAADAR